MKYGSRQLLLLAAIPASILLAILAYHQPGVVLAPGIDSSWAYGVTYTFQQHLVPGRDVYFTFGPLGFLEHTVPLTTSLLESSARFWLAASMVYCYVVLLLAITSSPNRWFLPLNLALGLLLVFFTDDLMQRLLILAYASVLLHAQSGKWPYLLTAQAALVMCLLIKFSYGIVVVALYAPYILVHFLRTRQPWVLVTGYLVPVLLYLLVWLSLYGTLSGSIGYLQGGLEFSRGSTSAMAQNPENDWLGIAAMLFAFVAASMVALPFRPASRDWLPLCFLGPLFIWFKYAFGREDSGHFAYLMSFITYVGILWVMVADGVARKLITALLLYGCFASWNYCSTVAMGKAEFSPSPSYYSLETFRGRWNNAVLAEAMRREIQGNITPLILPPDLIQLIGNHEIDFYPWETLIAYTNNLNWKPRPVYQSYISYTPFLDHLNQVYYESEHAPEFILWHHHSYQDIDNRYPFSTDPLTLAAILSHYQLQRCSGSFCLWQHSPSRQLVPQTLDDESSALWNSWVELPITPSATIIRARVDAPRTLLGKLNLALWKEGGIEIDYLLKSGETRTHTLLLDNARSGIWASPYLANLVPGITAEPVSPGQLKQLLGYPRAEGYIEKSEGVPGGTHIAGWGLLPFRSTATQQVTLLFYNENHAYQARSHSRARPGITEHFGKTGIVDLETSGIDETIRWQGMAPGTYRIGFVVQNAGETRSYTQEPAISLIVPEHPDQALHNVKAIRLRTTRPWAFEPGFTVTWETLSLTGPRTW